MNKEIMNNQLNTEVVINFLNDIEKIIRTNKPMRYSQKLALLKISKSLSLAWLNQNILANLTFEEAAEVIKARLNKAEITATYTTDTTLKERERFKYLQDGAK